MWSFAYKKRGGGERLHLGDEVVEGFVEQPTPEPLRYTLTAIATFYNRAHRLQEWLEHHIWQGVQHFYLIDQGSNDNFWKEIEPYISGGWVTMLTPAISEGGGIDAQRNEAFQRHKGDSKWIAVIDVDTYLYPSSRDLILRELLEKEYADDIAGVYTYATLFDGTTNATCLRKAATGRRVRPSDIPKGIVRSRYTIALKMHMHEHIRGKVVFPSSFKANVYETGVAHNEVNDHVLKDAVTARHIDKCW